MPDVVRLHIGATSWASTLSTALEVASCWALVRSRPAVAAICKAFSRSGAPCTAQTGCSARSASSTGSKRFCFRAASRILVFSQRANSSAEPEGSLAVDLRVETADRAFFTMKPFPERFEAALRLIVAVLRYFEFGDQGLKECFDRIDMHVHDFDLTCTRELSDDSNPCVWFLFCS